MLDGIEVTNNPHSGGGFCDLFIGQMQCVRQVAMKRPRFYAGSHQAVKKAKKVRIPSNIAHGSHP